MHLGHSGHDDHLSHSKIISEGWRSQPFLQKPVPHSLNLQSNCTAFLCCSTPEYNTACCSHRLGISTCSVRVAQVVWGDVKQAGGSVGRQRLRRLLTLPESLPGTIYYPCQTIGSGGRWPWGSCRETPHGPKMLLSDKGFREDF